MAESWRECADRLEAEASMPSEEQIRVAALLDLDIGKVPAPVAAEIIKMHLSSALLTNPVPGYELPESFRDLEARLGVSDAAQLVVGTRSEVSAWYQARYALLTARGLRDLQPQVGDIVAHAGDSDNLSIISSIGRTGVINLKGGPGRRSWPNYLSVATRNDGSEAYQEQIAAIEANRLNAQRIDPNWSADLDRLAEYRVPLRLPSSEALRELEDLLESGESNEAPFQELLERNPELLASLVHGNWGTFVIPRTRLGSEYITDFLVFGVSSKGPDWIAVELEAPRHEILINDGDLRGATRHAVKQINDWREWLTTNVAYARNQLHLFGINNRLPGLVVIGRASPTIDRDPARSQIAEQANIHIHSWDWLLRATRQIVSAGHPGNTLEYDFR